MMKERDDGTTNPSTEKMLEELNIARFRMTRRTVSGYDVGDVDAFLDKMIAQVQASKTVLPMLRKVKFRTSPHQKGSYEVADVDAFLDRLESFAKGDESAFDGTDSQSPTGIAKWPVLVGFGLVLVLLVVIVLITVL